MTADRDGRLRTLRERARGPRKSVTVFGPAAYADLVLQLERFDVSVTHEPLPVPESQGYLTVRRGEAYLGSVPAAALGALAASPASVQWDDEVRESACRELVSLLSGTSFVMDEKRRLVATAREVEDRAARVGRGRLHATFQSLAAFRSQAGLYRRLAGETDLRVAVFGRPDWEPPDIDGVTVYRDEAGDLAEFWVVAFDGGDDTGCALIAEETDPGAYTGVVTYDESVVDDLTASLDGVLGR